MAATANGQQNDLYTYDSFGGNRKKSDRHFLWWCAGADQNLLREFPSEHAKYAGLGGVILATFVLAALSAGYAIFSVFDNSLWAISFALVWGLIIFNFDRFLVSTMRKYGVSIRKQLYAAIPRIILALLIGITIARPLELKIFEREINVKVAENRHQKMLANDSLIRLENQAAISQAETERTTNVNRRNAIEDTIHRLQSGYLEEADGTGGSMQRGIQHITRLKQEAYEKAKADYAGELLAVRNAIHTQDSILNATHAEMDARQKNFEAQAAAGVGFLERNKALSDLSAKESSVFWANLLISLLVILIETAPVLSKLIVSVGPYDVALAKNELMQMAQSESEMRRDKQMVYDRLDEFYRKKKEMASELSGKLADLQRKHIDEDLGRWKRGERITNGRVTLDELARKLKEQYDVKEETVL